MSKTPRTISWSFLGAGLIAAVIGVAVAIAWRSDGLGPPPPQLSGFLWPNPRPLIPFKLTDHNGNPFTLDNLRGHWSFVFFGYTNCPDICPITMTVLKGVEDLLSKDSAPAVPPQFVFVSVDPERDNPSHLRSYVQHFHKDFIGATGEQAQMTALTRHLGIVYFKAAPDEHGEYLVDHSASILLLDPEARFIGVFSPPHSAEEIADEFRTIRSFVEKSG